MSLKKKKRRKKQRSIRKGKKPVIRPSSENAGQPIVELLKKAVSCHQSGRLADAERYYKEILAKDGNHSDALHLLGVLASQVGKHALGAQWIARAIEINPNEAMYFNNLAHVFKKLDRPDLAITGFETALSLDSGFVDALSQMVHHLQKVCDWNKLDGYVARLDQATRAALNKGQKPAESPYINVTRYDDPHFNFKVAQAWSADIAERMAPLQSEFDFDPGKLKKEKISIGYLSSDFHNHPIGHLIAGLFNLHNRDEFTIYGYACGMDDGSHYRTRIASGCDEFIDLTNLNHVDAARRIHADGIDILVDLNGHTTGNRLEICAMRPAPIQVSYLGFPGTSGADFFDYLLADRIVAPEDHLAAYSENLVYLPHCYQVNDDNQLISNKIFTKSSCGLPEDSFVFCSFNQSHKIEPVMFDVWMNIMDRVPKSVLWLLGHFEGVRSNLRQAARDRNVSPDRIIFAERLPKDEHLARHRAADLILDTRIYNGHTTTSDALWAGVPVAALMGSHFASRVSASILNAIGLPELVAPDLKQYEELAVELANDPEKLQATRNKLIQNRVTEPLFNTSRSVLNLERGFKEMWDIYCRGENPRQIEVREYPHLQNNDKNCFNIDNKELRKACS